MRCVHLYTIIIILIDITRDADAKHFKSLRRFYMGKLYTHRKRTKRHRQRKHQRRTSPSPSTVPEYVSLLALSKRQLDELTADLNMTTSRIRKEHKRASFPKKMTAKDLDDLVFIDSEYVQAVEKVTEATHRYLMVKGMVSTMEHKKDCLIQLSSNSRQETRLYS